MGENDSLAACQRTRLASPASREHLVGGARAAGRVAAQVQASHLGSDETVAFEKVSEAVTMRFFSVFQVPPLRRNIH